MNITLIYKKHNPSKSKDYRSVSLLSAVSKFFEKIVHNQISQFVKSFLTLYLFCYRKGFITPQQALYLLLRNGKWRIGQSLKLVKSYLSNL